MGLGPHLKAQPSPVITNLSQIKALTRVEAGTGVPLHIQGTVVCYDAGWHQLYLHDGRETCYFNADDFQIQPEIGQTIVISGTTLGDTFFTNMSLAVLGKSTLPAAKKLVLSELGREHGEWIETTGRLLSIENSRGRPALLLHDKGQNALAYILGAPLTNDLKSLMDCDVLIRGINASKTNEHGGLEAPLIFIPGIEQVSARSTPQPKISQIPVASIGSLLNRELDFWTNTWVHVNGLVVSYEPGRSIIVKDPTGVIRARVIQLTEIHSDARLDVWGFLQSSGDETFLNSAWFELAPPAAQELAATPKVNAAVRERFPAVLEQLTDILKLSREEAALNLPVRLHGVITYADPEWRNGFLQDKTGAVYVDLDPALKNLRPGQWVELQGQTSPGGFAPEVLSSAVQVLGTTNLPAPVRVDLEDLADGHLDAHWVEMDGVVRRIDELSGHVSLSLMTPKGRFKAIIPGSGPLPGNLIDAQVSVQGACTSELNVRRQLSGITLHAPGFEHVKVLEPPPSDPFAIETTPLAAVATFDPHRLAGRRVKVHGVVTLRMPGQGFILQDETGGIRVLAQQTNQVTLGDSLEVLGFPAIGDFSPYLEEGVFRRIGRGQPPAPKQTTADQILLHGSEDALLVEIKARLLQGVPRSANPQIVLQDGPIIFTAHLAVPAARAEVPALQSGSLLRLTGVCAIQGGEHHEPQSFRLQLRHPDDIELLETAPWWTARHAFMLAASLMIAVAAALAWIALLRRQVHTQTELIRQKLKDEAALEQRFQELFEHANDMLYTHDLEGRITSINQAGERLLQRTRREMLSRNLLEFVASEQQPAARQWLDSVLKGIAPPTVEFDFPSGSGQRVTLEISTRLIEQNGRLLEVEGSARDVTERKRLEREILEISNREQRRIGHDLHDGVCQQLAGIAFMTSNLADELEERGVSESAQAEKISGLLNKVVTQTRGVARGLFPVRLEEHGLVSALEELAANASELFKINCRFTVDNPPADVDNGIAIHLYYIVLEAIANASKHGEARNIDIRLEPAGPRYRLSVQDDGAGFSLSEKPRSGMGIGIMRYRARVIGATLTLQSKPGSGTAVICLFLPAPGEALPNGVTYAEPAPAAELS